MRLEEKNAMEFFGVCIFIQSDVIAQKPLVTSGDPGWPKELFRGVTDDILALAVTKTLIYHGFKRTESIRWQTEEVEVFPIDL